MPQPLPRGKNISFDFGREMVLQRPVLAAYISAVLTHWNEIETHIALFVAALMGEAEAETIIKVYLALQTDGGRKATIDTVAATKLPPADLTRFQDIQKDIGSRYAERNKAVHGAWGISPEYPNDLLWYDPRESTAMFPRLMATDKRTEREALLAETNKCIRVYNEQDFKDILARFEVTYVSLNNFTKPYISPLFEVMNK